MGSYLLICQLYLCILHPIWLFCIQYEEKYTLLFKDLDIMEACSET